jgi:hypothetical protein
MSSLEALIQTRGGLAVHLNGSCSSSPDENAQSRIPGTTTCANARLVIEKRVRCSKLRESGAGWFTEHDPRSGTYHGRLHGPHGLQRCIQLVIVPLPEPLRRQRYFNVG